MESVLPARPTADAAAPVLEPLRERRRRELRQHLSDVATQMVLERGFDAVRVADVARACGVSEKTVFNHFTTKESLLEDRWDQMIDAVRTRLADPQAPPVLAAVDVLLCELDYLTDPPGGTHLGSWIADLRRFSDLVRSTPSLVAHERGALDHLAATIAAALADRSSSPHDDPEAQITATAVTGLWTVFYRSLHQHLATGDAPRIQQVVRHDLRRAADLLTRGL